MNRTPISLFVLRKYPPHSAALLIILVLLLFVISGCTKRMMTPEEITKSSTKIYPHVAPETILNAVSDLFFLADDQAFQITQAPDHLIATRTHSLDIGINFAKGQDIWKVETRKTPDGTMVVLDAKSEETWMAGKTEVETPNGPAMYTQFWNRLDFLLGQSTSWMTCRHLSHEYLEDRTWGDTWWLCSELKDRIPPELIKGTWRNAKGHPLSVEDQNFCSGKVQRGDYGVARTKRQREVYQAICLRKEGYEKIEESPGEPLDTQSLDDRDRTIHPLPPLEDPDPFPPILID